MAKDQLPVWECACGHREHMHQAPEECVQCGQLDSFMKLPEELVAEEEEEEMELEEKQLKQVKATKKPKRGKK